MGETLDARKIRLVRYITALQDEGLVSRLEELFEQAEDSTTEEALYVQKTVSEQHLVEPTEEKINLRKTLDEQGYKSPDKSRFVQIAEELNVQEPIEDLLALLTK